ncbi:KTSC domain-containing protein [Paracoccus sp. TK19116]|uniref:KTSC domain-containing protein n=1 Tax=Paracoccus albicereus TaxID=2922394 RepID=A0ABT1MRU8_9RHOB|nr:KTSC domain-containing protein [Paracoccus albicereus]MCQ0971020.1 KTSC domain-containing protein [Paracoccus albicereus]
MIRDPVSSSNIASIGYDSDSETLEIEFTNGSIYQYFNVPSGLHEQLMAAPSKGQFLNLYIRNAYPYSRVG